MIRRLGWLGLAALAAWWWLANPAAVSVHLEDLPGSDRGRFDSRLSIERPPLQTALATRAERL